jgi:DNA-binding NarL/FixJ family response regulator
MAASNPVRVQIMHADPLMSAGLAAVLDQRDDVLPVTQQAQVVITDYHQGVGLAQSRLADMPRILIVTHFDKEWHVRSALADGVSGYLIQTCTRDELICAVQQVHRRTVYLSAQVRGLLNQERYPELLTGRENDVLQLLATGRCNKAIARDLGIEVGTVKTHLKGVMSKLGATARTHAVVLATQRGLVGQRTA